MTTRAAIPIRLATRDDAEAIHATLLKLATHVGDSAKVKSTPDDIRRYGFGAEPAFHCLIAEADREVAGICLFFNSFSTWFGRPGIYIQDLFVDERFRGQRLGERLMQRAAAICRERGGTYIRLAVDHENPTAMAFYRRLGLVHRFDDFIYAAYGDVFDALAVTGGEDA